MNWRAEEFDAEGGMLSVFENTTWGGLLHMLHVGISDDTTRIEITKSAEEGDDREIPF